MALADPSGMSNMDQVGLALSYLGDAANQFSGRPTGYATANLQSLKALQDQLLRTQAIKKQQSKDSALAELTGGPQTYGDGTTINWDSGRQNPGLATTQDVMTSPGIAGQAPTDAQPGIANQPATFETQPVPMADRLARNADFQNDQRASLIRAFPDEVGKSMVASEFAAPTPVSTPEGGRTDFVRNGQVVSTIQGGDKEPEKVKEVVALFGPDWRSNAKAVEYYGQITRPASVSLTANTQSENKFEQELGTQWGKEAAELGPAANSARDRVASVQQFLALSDQVKTGKLTPTLGEVSGWAQSLGIDPATLGVDPKTATATQVMDKIQNRLAMQNIGPGGLPANNFSEADRKFVQATTVNKANTPEANHLIAQIGIAADKRTIDKEKSWLDARSRGVNYPAWKQQWNKYVQDTPMFPKMDTPEQAAALDSGTMFTDSTGRIRVRP